VEHKLPDMLITWDRRIWRVFAIRRALHGDRW